MLAVKGQQVFYSGYVAAALLTGGRVERVLLVVFELIDDVTIYPVTAYDLED